MTISLIEGFVTLLLVTYSCFWYRQQSSRRKKTWGQIVSQFRGHDWGIEEISETYLYKGQILATADDIWPRIAGAYGLWAMYKNAPVLVELADYAARHGDGVDAELLATLRGDAFQIRLCVMSALAKHALFSSSQGASRSALRAASTYNAMLASLTEFMQEHSGPLFPNYLDAIA